MEFNDYAQIVNASVQQNNAWSAEQAQKQMDFQERMSNTAHQREVADLKAAGLNPVLSAHTNGASSPSGAMATGDTSGTSALVDVLNTVLETDAANARAAMYAGASNLIQSQNYSKNPLLSLVQDVLEDRFGMPMAQIVNKGIDKTLEFLGLGPDKNTGNSANGIVKTSKKLKQGFQSVSDQKFWAQNYSFPGVY